MATTISNGESGSSVRTKLNNIWEGLQINEISETISDTAVDVIVYDTRKDRDGGAWRQRTQHTSWYNETLNTATRGSRKEFPAVAVIVAESSQVTIYDGDDPDLPMWMVFDISAVGSVSISSTYAENGQLLAGSNGVSGYLYSWSFPSALRERWYSSSRQIGTGSFNAVTYADASGSGIVSNTVNDVAMTVLPNAPIDAATGLPVPTIAVATDGGVSVIKDDGTVADLDGLIESNNDSGHVELDADGNIWFTSRQNSAGLYNGIQYFNNISGTTDASVADDIFVDISRSSYASAPYFKERNTQMLSNAWAGNYGLTKVAQDYTNRDATMFAEVTSDYNTGWMNGDIKLATLSDTDDTDVTGSELVTNGTFDTDTSGWSTQGGATLSVVSNALRVTNTGTDNPVANQTITGLTVGETYVISAEIKTISAGVSRVDLDTSVDGNGNVIATTATPKSGTLTFTATTASITIQLYSLTSSAQSGEYAEFDNVTLRLAEEDRSVNGNGLQVFGSITKDPVATGADLVAYSGFSSSNYLEQPYNSDLDFGTGDFSIITWAKTNGSVNNNQTLFNTGYYSGSAWDYWIALQIIGTNGNIRFATAENGVFTTEDAAVDADTGTWTCIVAVRRNGVLEVYKDGVFLSSESGTVRDLTIDANAKSRIGLQLDDGSTSAADDTSIALLRVSATAPTAEQIKKIYEDEKVLFQENAEATLYGDSDAVTALAYDDSTNILSVGTSAGRSDFQGLRRVNNTTNAVGAAISASNGLIVEE